MDNFDDVDDDDECRSLPTQFILEHLCYIVLEKVITININKQQIQVLLFCKLVIVVVFVVSH